MPVLQIPYVYYYEPGNIRAIAEHYVGASDSLRLLLWPQGNESNRTDKTRLCWLLWVHRITSCCLLSFMPPVKLLRPVLLPGLPPIRAANLGRRDTLDNAPSLITADTTREAQWTYRTGGRSSMPDGWEKQT